MNAFLAEARTTYQNIILNPQHYNKLRVVLGNESCDLDSAIASLVYGFVLHHEFIEENRKKSAVLPLLNIPHDDLPLKTEVTYFLKANDVEVDWVPTRGFRDLLDLAKIHQSGNLELTLVDHHTLGSHDHQLKDSVVEVIDHRPQHPAWSWSNISSNVTIENVGSCCTLIAQKLKQSSPHLITKEVAKLLLGAILLDTVNLSPTAGRATPLDQEMVDYLQATTPVDRQQLYTDLVKAKSDIGKLTTSQLFRKDMKIIAGVPIVGVPILIQELKNRPDFVSELVHFARILNQVPLVMLMGVWIDGDDVTRDLAFFGTADVVDAILRPLLASNDPALELVEISGHGVPNLRLFSQGNFKATRKHIGPIVAKTAEAIKSIQKCGLN